MTAASGALAADGLKRASRGEGVGWRRRATRHAPLLLVLVLYSVLAVGYNLAVPVGEAPDEQTHLDYVYFLRGRHRLPRLAMPEGIGSGATTPDARAPARADTRAADGITQGGHPPLAYLAAAAAVAAMDAPPPTYVVNPHFTFNWVGRRVPNRYVHDSDMVLPYRGAKGIAAVHVMRLVSWFAGLLVVTSTYAIARRVAPAAAHASVAAAMVAFLPGFTFASGTFNNDMVANGLAALVLLGAVRAAQGRVARRDLAGLGLAMGLALLAKMTVTYLGAVMLASLAVQAARSGEWRRLPVRLLVVGAAVALVAGWWFVRNARIYGLDDPTGWKAFLVAGAAIRRRHPLLAELPIYWRLQYMSFVGLFGWTSVPLPNWVYIVAWPVMLLAFVGLGLLVARRRELPGDARAALLVLGLAVALAYLAAFRLGAVFDLVAAQGRYLYSALPAIGVLLVAGLATALPANAARWGLPVLAGATAALSAAALFLVIVPAFRPPDVLAQKAPQVMARADFGNRVRLVGYDLDMASLRSGADVPLTLYWTGLPGNAVAPPNEADIVAVRLVDAGGAEVARWEGPPFEGRLPTQAWAPERVLRQDLDLAVSPAAVPGAGALVVGLYPEGHASSALPVAVAGRPVGDAYTSPLLRLLPASVDAEEAPPRTHATYGAPELVRLVGYELEGTLAPGATVSVTLEWLPVARVPRAYTVFVHLEDASGAVLATGDSPPQAGRLPTTLWRPGEVVRDVHAVGVPARLPAGPLTVAVGLYDPRTSVRLPAFAPARAAEGGTGASARPSGGEALPEGGGAGAHLPDDAFRWAAES